MLKQKPFKNLLCFREKSKNRQLLRNGSEAQCGVNCFAYFFVLRFFSQSKIALVNFLHFQKKTYFFFNIYPASLYDNFLSMCCGLDSFFHILGNNPPLVFKRDNNKGGVISGFGPNPRFSIEKGQKNT